MDHAIAEQTALGLNFGFSRRIQPLLQTEAAECGLACLAMVASHHGYRTDLPSLRRRFSISLKGATLKQLIDVAGQLELAARPLRLELEELGELKTPCILHWDLNHFVVLVRVTRRGITILDPARGEVQLTLAEVRISANVTADFGIVTGLGVDAGLRGFDCRDGVGCVG